MKRKKQVLNFITRDENEFLQTLKDALSNYALWAYDVEASANEIASTNVYFINIYRK